MLLLLLLLREHQTEARFRHNKVRDRKRVGEEKNSALALFSFPRSSFFFSQPRTKKITLKKLISRPRPPPAPLGLCPRRRPARRRALPLQRGQDLPGRRDRAHGCGARLEARDAR